MSSTSTMAILILLLCAFAAHGIPTLEIQGRCQCIQLTRKFIHPKFMKSMKYIPKGLHCERLEIIVKLKSGKKICVTPHANWLNVIFKADIDGDKALGRKLLRYLQKGTQPLICSISHSSYVASPIHEGCPPPNAVDDGGLSISVAIEYQGFGRKTKKLIE